MWAVVKYTKHGVSGVFGPWAEELTARAELDGLYTQDDSHSYIVLQVQQPTPCK
jgi:hypothetical protein